MNRLVITLVLVTVSFVLLYAKPALNSNDKTVAGGLFCDVCKLLGTGLLAVPAGEEEAYLENEVESLCGDLGFFAHFCNLTLIEVSVLYIIVEA